MPKNMTADEIDAAEKLMERACPDSPSPAEIAAAFPAVSFTLLGGDCTVLLRMAAEDGETRDLMMSQAVAVALVGSLAKSLHGLDFMDSAGHVVADPSPLA